uniref:Uncharacterized protein n=1 Tax=Angiostrongylus cantonensis TaxID=6313 RepID=A0A0K0CYV2_ANGCA
MVLRRHPLDMLHFCLGSFKAINEVYNFLHTFAQSLQLDVLFCQASQLAVGRLRNKIVIENYNPKERVLSIGYWVQRITKKGFSNHVRLEPQYRVTIFGDDGCDTTLNVRHHPVAPDLGQLDSRSGYGAYQLIVYYQKRWLFAAANDCFEFENGLKQQNLFQLLSMPVVIYEFHVFFYLHSLRAVVPCLWLPLLRDSVETREECVVISVNMFSGRVLCSLDAIGTQISFQITSVLLVYRYQRMREPTTCETMGVG